ncbi:metallophosphoesterase family protein [Fusibacter sp. JL298sf-3]
MKILHLADIHINRIFKTKTPAVQKVMKAAVQTAFVNAIDFALETSVDFVLIVGDLLDDKAVSYAYETVVTETLGRYIDAGGTVLYATGNHDVTHASPWIEELKERDRFVCFDTSSPEVRAFNIHGERRQVKFVGCGHTRREEPRNLIEAFPEKSDDALWIGLCHAFVTSAGTAQTSERYLPTTVATIERCGYDYFALGHIHKRQFITERIAYSGSVQGLHINETGNRGGILLTYENGVLTPTPIDFQVVGMQRLSVPVPEEVTTLLALENHLFSQLESASVTTYWRIELTGESTLASVLRGGDNVSAVEAHLVERLGCVCVELDVSGIHQSSAMMTDATVLSEALKLLAAPLENEVLREAVPGASREKKERWLNRERDRLKGTLLRRMLRQKNED